MRDHVSMALPSPVRRTPLEKVTDDYCRITWAPGRLMHIHQAAWHIPAEFAWKLSLFRRWPAKWKYKKIVFVYVIPSHLLVLFLLFLSVPGLHLQAGSAGLPAAHRPLLPPAQHLQQGQGGGAEPGRRARRVRGEFNNLITRPPDRLWHLWPGCQPIQRARPLLCGSSKKWLKDGCWIANGFLGWSVK